MIPEVPALRQSLDALELAEVENPETDNLSLMVCEKRPQLLLSDAIIEDKFSLILRQKPGAPIAPARLVEQVAKAAEKLGHPHLEQSNMHRSQIGAKLLAIGAAFHQAGVDPILAINIVLTAITPARLAQWAVLVNPATNVNLYHFGDFIYGVVDLGALESRCDRAGSDYFSLYSKELWGKRAISRSSREVKILDVNAIAPPVGTNPKKVPFMYRLADDYYTDLAVEEQRLFMLDLDQQQAIFGAAGLGTIPSDTLRRLESHTKWISVFTRAERKHGWVVPHQNFFKLVSTEPKALASGYEDINKALKLSDWPKRALDPSIQRFSEYVSEALLYERQGKFEEALLHLVFALDLLLGGDAGESLTEVVAERVAILCHRALGQTVEQVIPLIRETYKMRSGYAHRGEKGMLGAGAKQGSLDVIVASLGRISRAALGAACFARQQHWCEGPEARKQWVKRVDVLRAKRQAGMPLEEGDLTDLGINLIRLTPDKTAGVGID
jgi:hypothetical protein